MILQVEECPSNSGRFNPFKFTSQYQSTSSGLFDFGARTYDPGTARFIQLDPYPDNLLGPSRYAYASCNPTNRVDPTGLSHCTPEQTLALVTAIPGLAAGYYLFLSGIFPPPILLTLSWPAIGLLLAPLLIAEVGIAITLAGCILQ